LSAKPQLKSPLISRVNFDLAGCAVLSPFCISGIEQKLTTLSSQMKTSSRQVS
jgi:hypothetical protein